MSSDTPPGEEPRTVFMPFGGDPLPAPSPPETPRPPEPTTGNFQTQFAARVVGQSIQVGDVLNHIFEVKRFIARGGMGEVFEGVNVNSDERVAIKVMLPSLAADANVIAMFRKEARTLTRLQHEALVQYRVLAQEPQLGVLYIVTEYVDGDNLADVLGKQRPTPVELVALLRRLASGLRVAHQLGAIHRDMSPDNVLLEGGRLAQARIIDFGIAKDLDPGSKTIIGDGFAGKLNYVAPEQLGDFGREIGPWTDVYSLGLVILAVALGKNVQMGGSLVDAVDKRRAGPDLSALPPELAGVLARMLAPNPADRLRSMDEVLAALQPPAAPPVSPKRTGLIVGVGVGVAVLAGLLLFATGRHGGTDRAAGPSAPTVLAVDPVEAARSAINATLPSVACTWLDIARVDKVGDHIAVALTGVAGNPLQAQNEISRALVQQKIAHADIDFEAVSPITQSGCAALDAYRQIRSPDGQRLSVPQHKFEMQVQPAGSEEAGKVAANEIINVDVADPKLDFTLLGIEPSGKITDLIANRADLEQASRAGKAIAKVGEGRYRLQIVVDHADWSGYLLLTGTGPFPADLVAPNLGARGPDWLNAFVSKAASNGWQADMVWAKSVDEVKEGAGQPTAPSSVAPPTVTAVPTPR